MERPLDARALKNITKGIQYTMQRGKVAASKYHLAKARSLGGDWDSFPKTDEGLAAYHTSLAQRNRYNDVAKFYTYMEKSPKKWDKSFFYIPKATGTAALPLIAEAADYARKIVRQQVDKYPTYQWKRGNSVYTSPRTYQLRESVIMKVNGRVVGDPKRAVLTSENGGDTVFSITNVAPYASTAEAHALYFTKTRGIIFYAANKVQKKYPGLGVLFTYVKSDTHKWDEPLLLIGSVDVIGGTWSRPGRNIRERKGYVRRLKSYAKRNLDGIEIV